jgi:hypothetical protein
MTRDTPAHAAARAWLHEYGINTSQYTDGGGDHPAMASLAAAFEAFAAQKYQRVPPAACAMTHDDIAAAIWEARSNHPRVKGMTWAELQEAAASNPSAWEEERERALRQADAVLAAPTLAVRTMIAQTLDAARAVLDDPSARNMAALRERMDALDGEPRRGVWG